MKALSGIVTLTHTLGRVCAVLCCMLATHLALAQEPLAQQDSLPAVNPIEQSADSLVEAFTNNLDTLATQSVAIDTTALAVDSVATPLNVKTFNPDGMRAVWLSALCPGLGQIYNRRYWKLPIVVGGFVGLAYATTWNDRMYADYQQAYLDIMDTDPTTNSYMDFFPSYYTEADIDKSWLTNLLKTRKDTYRHYRDYCVVGMVALYLVCILDAYVDAEMFHFDMSPDLAMQVKPALIPLSLTQQPAVGMQCAITF